MKNITKWNEVDRCWLLNEIESVEQLNKKALKFYDEKVMLFVRLSEKAMNLK